MLENIISKKTIPADGVQRQWDIPFTFYKLADVGFYVSYDNGKTIEKITQNIRYEKDGNYFVYPTEESKLPVLPVGATVLLLRETENKQLETSETFPFNSRDIERMADNLTMQIQDLKRDSLRSVKSSLFSEETGEEFAERFFEKADEAIESASKAQKSADDAERSNQESLLNAQNAASSAVLATSASESAREYANAAKNDADRAEEAKVNNEEVLAAAEAFATRSETASEESKKYSEDAKKSVIDAEQFAISAAASAESAKNSADLAEEIIKDLDTGVYTKEEIDNKITVIEADIDANADAILKTRGDFMESDSELQQQINAQATAIVGKQDKLTAGENITIEGNVISATGGGGEVPDNVYTADNLIAGKNVTFTEVPPEGGIDEHTIDVWHFEEDSFADDTFGELGNVKLSFSSGSYSSIANGKFGKGLTGSSSNNWGFSFVCVNKDLNLATPYTLDFWIKPNYSGDRVELATNLYNWKLILYSNKLALDFGYSGLPEKTSEETLENNVWSHIALTTDGTTFITVYLNGKPCIHQEGGLYVYDGSASGTMSVNAYGPVDWDEIRLSDNIRYTEEFTPPTKAYTVATGPSKTAVNASVAVPTKTSELENDSGFLTGLPDNVYTQTNLLGGKDIEIVPEPVEGGIDEHTVAVWHLDDTDKWIDGEGNEYDTTFAYQYFYTSNYAKFGTSSRTSPNSAGTRIYCSDLESTYGMKRVSLYNSFTIDWWYYFSKTSSIITSGTKMGFTGTANGINLSLLAYDKFSLDVRTNGIETKSNEISIQDCGIFAGWNHFAIEYDGSGETAVATLYVNGNPVATISGINKVESLLDTFQFGCTHYQMAYDEVRISNIARYKGQPFTPPTEAYRVAEPTGNMVVNFIGESGGAFDFQGTEEEFNAAVEAGQITDDTVSLVVDDNSGELVATKAELAAVDASKADTALSNVLANIDYVIESKFPTADDPTWYRVYKSGWVEQGGIATEPYYSNVNTVTYSKPFKDTNYTLVVSLARDGDYGEANMAVYGTAFNKTATGFQNYTHQSSPKNWYACGIGA